MDALSELAPQLGTPPSLGAAMPPECPLAMPVQDLRSWSRDGLQIVETETFAARARLAALRLAVFGGAVALTVYGAREMYGVVSVSGSTTELQWLLLGLFVVNFSWIALAFTSAVAGAATLLLRRRARVGIPERLAGRTAVVMPVYNESTARCFAALQAIYESVEATGRGEAFDYVVLSDTTQPDAWVAEQRAFEALRARLGPGARVFYRRRMRNTNRKAGNIEEFVTRWGGAYDHLLVLDADSVMSGECVVTLAAVMEADPASGIVQSLPLILNRNTLFARLQQFAAGTYGPVIAAGLAAWSGRDGNYWGHNAIIRTRAFAASCGLPHLEGRPPFGGHILSHDFVEAALIRRAGWTVTMLPTLKGSYEESPPSLIDLATRDRRWAQGNLQHLRVVGAAGLRWPTRQHFATGVFSYLASPLWLAQLTVGLVLVLQTRFAKPEYFTSQFTLHPAWPRFDPERALSLFALTMAVLLAPKLFGLIIALTSGRTRRGSGGAVRLVLSALIELIGSALVAPIMMLIQSGAVVGILLGRDTGWNPQRRDDGSIPLGDIVRRHRAHTLFGVVALVSAFLISPYLAAWMSPTILGLVLAIPISALGASRVLGLALKRAGLLLTPEERRPPPVVARANALAAELARDGLDEADGLRALHADPALRARHVARLPPAPRRPRGEVTVDRAMAEAKLAEAADLEEALAWLAPKERLVVLSDRALLGVFAALPDLALRAEPAHPEPFRDAAE